MNKSTQERLFEMARQQTDLYTALASRPGMGTQRRGLISHLDPIDSEIARLSAEFYRRAALGECANCLYAEMVERAKTAAQSYNDDEERRWGAFRDWRGGVAGFYGTDEAETKMRHVRDIIQRILEAAGLPTTETTDAETLRN